MERIYIQRHFVILINCISAALTLLAIIGAIFIDIAAFFLLAVSLILSLLSLLGLGNRVYYNREKIRLCSIKGKNEYSWEEIRQIYIKRKPFDGYAVIFNFSGAIDEECDRARIYTDICTSRGMKTATLSFVNYNDLRKLLAGYDGSIIGK